MVLPPQTYQLVIFAWIFCAIASIFVAARLCVQLHFRVRPWREIFVILAWILCVGSAIQLSLENDWGWLDNTKVLTSPDDFYKGVRVWYSMGFTYYPCLWLCKMALLCFYGDLTPKRYFPKTWWTIAATWFLVVVVCIFQILKMLLGCWPFSDHFDLTSSCVSSGTFRNLYIYTAFHLTTDILAYTIPFVILRNLKISSKEARPAYVMFAIGAVNILSAVVIFFYSQGVYTFLREMKQWKSQVFSDAASYLMFLQQYSAVVIVCMPHMRRLFLGIDTESMRMRMHRGEQVEVQRDIEGVAVTDRPEIAATAMVAADEVKESEFRVTIESERDKVVSRGSNERAG